MANGDTTVQVVSPDDWMKSLDKKYGPTPAPTKATKPAPGADYTGAKLPPYPGAPPTPPTPTTPRAPGPRETPSGLLEGWGESIEQRQPPREHAFGEPHLVGEAEGRTGVGFPPAGPYEDVSPIAKSTPETEKLRQKFGGPEGAPPELQPTGLERPHPIAEAVKGKIWGLTQVPSTIAYGTGHTWAGPALGAYGQTVSDYADSVIDHYTKGTPISGGAKNLVKEFAENYGMFLGFDVLANKTIPWMVGTKEARESIENAKNFFGEQRQEWMDRQAQQFKSMQGKVETQQQKLLTQEIEPKARQEIITKETGATPASAAQAQVPDYAPVPGTAVQGPKQDAVIAEKGLRGTYYGVQKRVFNGLGKRYDELLTPELTKTELPSDPGAREKILVDVADKLKSNAQYRKENYMRFKGEVPKLFVKTKKFLRLPLDPDEELLDAGGPGNVNIDKADPRTGKSMVDEVMTMPDGTIRKSRQKPGTIGEMYNLLRFARRAAAEAPDKVSSEAASQVADSWTEALHKAGLPTDTWHQLRALDSQYRKAILDLPGEVSGRISEANNPIDIGDQFYNRPDTLTRVWKNANDEEKQILKDNWGQWATSELKKGDPWAKSETEAMVKAKAWGQMFPGTPMANPKSLLFDSGKIQLLKDSPQAQQEFVKGATSILMDQAEIGARADKDEAIRVWGKMGPVGQQKIREIRAITDPFQAAQLADDFFNKMSPEQFSRLTALAQPKFGYTGLEGAKLGEQGPPKSMGPWMLYMARKSGAFPAYMATAIANAAMGHGSMFWTVMATGAGATALREYWVGQLARGLTSPGWEAFQSSLANSDFARAGASTMKSTLRGLTVQKLQREMFGGQEPSLPPPSEPEPEKTSMNFGPMFKDLSRKQAVQIATERGRQDPGHLDQVQDLNKQVAGGATPDIHQDLSTGRLSNAEVAQMLAPTPGDPSGMFQGLDLADAVEAFSRGTDDEKSLALPALAQKMNNEGRNLPPAQRRALMAQLRQALGSEMA